MEGRAAAARCSPIAWPSMGIARTLQGVGLFAGLTVLENVMVGGNRFRRGRLAGALLGLPGLRSGRARAARAGDDCARAAATAPTSPIAIRPRCPTRSRSASRSRRALVAEPELLLLDEPAGGLGAEDMDDLAALIRELRGQLRGDAGRAPHGSGDGGVRPDLRARLRPADRAPARRTRCGPTSA